MSTTIVTGVGIFLIITLMLVLILLISKRFLVHTGNVPITINGEKTIEVASGQSLLTAMASSGVFLPSACGGKGSCGQCRVQVMRGGGSVLPTEKVHLTRKEQLAKWRLGCQVKEIGRAHV